MDAPQIEQVLVNLFVNAAQAMRAGGDLYVDVGRDPERDGVVISVRDTGGGIPKDILPNIFDPFFSTKGTKGTGLGLSASYGIIGVSTPSSSADATPNLEVLHVDSTCIH